MEELILKLKLQYFGHLMRTANSLEKFLMLGKIVIRRRGNQKMRRLDGITDAMDVNLEKLWEMVRYREPWTLHPATPLVCCSSWGQKESDIYKQLNNRNKT